jgi:hypothetical protein
MKTANGVCHPGPHRRRTLLHSPGPLQDLSEETIRDDDRAFEADKMDYYYLEDVPGRCISTGARSSWRILAALVCVEERTLREFLPR